MAAATDRAVVEPGSPETLGAHVVDGGVNFAVFAPAAERVQLCLFDSQGRESSRHELPGDTNGVRHGFVPTLGAGQQYGFRAAGRYEPVAGLRFNEQKLLLDPYAREIAGNFVWHDAVFDYDRKREDDTLVASELDSAPWVPRSVVTGPEGRAVSHCRRDARETLIYELNVRGFSMRHPAIPEAQRGKVAALGNREVIAHLKALGVTTVELMPLHAFVDEEFLARRGLRNFWGYNPVAFFAAEARYLGSDGTAGLRAAIATLHDANIEVVLDVVFNHTAEGGRRGPTLGFRGLANADYYRLLPLDRSEYINDTGCGNTVNTDSPVVRRLIVDCLRYWVTEIGVDGFRFDLATALGRTTNGFNGEHPLFAEIAREPALRGAKLIAEPWDVGPGGYRLGGFPGDWAEWNDQFRDMTRRFWRGDTGVTPDFARRLHGSAFIFEEGGRGPDASVNFVASHDGFTTADLVSFERKHNEANGEHNRDGHEHNFSSNHGVEGATGDLAIQEARRRHRLSLLATVLFAQGTPMLLAGDEFGHSQGGNNNAYAQDNETGWLDWGGLARDPEFFAEVCALTALRRELPLLAQSQYRHGALAMSTGLRDIEWHDAGGQTLDADAWDTVRTFGLLLSRPDDRGGDGDPVLAVSLLFNAGDADCEFRLPEVPVAGTWRLRWISTGEGDLSDGRLVLRQCGVACLVYEAHT